MTEVWSVRGIDPQVRDAVVKTARRRKVAVAAVLQEAVEHLLSPPRDSAQESEALLREGALWVRGRSCVRSTGTSISSTHGVPVDLASEG